MARAVVAGALLFAGCAPSPNEAAIRTAEDVIRDGLNDPDSGRFSDEYVVESKEFGTTVCGYVNAKNAFGGYVGKRRFYVWVVSKIPYVEQGSDYDSQWELEWARAGCGPFRERQS